MLGHCASTFFQECIISLKFVENEFNTSSTHTTYAARFYYNRYTWVITPCFTNTNVHFTGKTTLLYCLLTPLALMRVFTTLIIIIIIYFFNFVLINFIIEIVSLSTDTYM